LGTTIFLGKIEIPWEIGVPKLALKEPKEIHTSRRLKWSWAVMQIPDPIHGLGMSKQFFSGDARKKRPLIMTANSIKADSPLGNRHGLLVLVSNWGPTQEWHGVRRGLPETWSGAVVPWRLPPLRRPQACATIYAAPPAILVRFCSNPHRI
jgi:hypothetical protein